MIRRAVICFCRPASAAAVLLCSLLALGGEARAEMRFADPMYLETGQCCARQVIVADFNGDGKPDLAVANASPEGGDVSVFLGNGRGGFGPARTFSAGDQGVAQSSSTGGNPVSLAAGDFNGDSHEDLVVANFYGSNVAVLLGDGVGGFAAPIHTPVSGRPGWIAVADFNHDSRPDVAIADASGPRAGAEVLFGTGDGTFGAGVKLDTSGAGKGVAVADLNGDGNPDIALANIDESSISVILGDGHGGFAPALNYATSSFNSSIVIADFNGDTHPDLAFSNNTDVSVMTGDGLGGFALKQQLVAGQSADAVTAGDFNGDGTQDIVSVSDSGVTGFPNDGQAVFGPAEAISPAGENQITCSDFCSVSAGDFNGDGDLDLAAVADRSAVAVMLNRRTYTAPTTTPSPSPPTTSVSVTPTVSGASQSNPAWREGNRLPSFARKNKRPPVGTTFSFALNESASVSLAFTQQVGGRKVKGKCVALTNKNRRKPACTRTVTRGVLSFRGHTGLNKVFFQGRITVLKELPLGRYTLLITASAAGQRSKPQTLRFTIVK